MKIYKLIGLVSLLLISGTLISQSITQQPINDTVCSGGDAAFLITTTGEPANYQWQLNVGMGWIDLIGEESLNLNILNCDILFNDNEYRCIIIGIDTSEVAKLVVYNDPSWDVISVSPTNVCEGGEITFTATYSDGFGGVVEWVRSLTTLGAGLIVNSPNIENVDGLYYYRPTFNSTYSGCELSDGLEYEISVVDDPIWDVISIPTTSICEGGEITFSTALLGGFGGNLEWIKSTTSGGSGSIITSPNIENIDGTFYYRAQYVSTVNGCNLTDGAETLITVVNDPSWDVISVPVIAICEGGEINFSATISGGLGGNVDWIRSTVPGGAGSTISSPQTENTDGTYYYRPQYTSTVSGCVLNDGIERTIHVEDDPVWSNISVPVTEICKGGVLTFTASLSGGFGGSSFWIRSTTSGDDGFTITSPHNEGLSGTFYYRPKYISTVSGCNLGDGAETTITVVDDPTWNTVTFPVSQICNGGQLEFSTSFSGGVGGTTEWIRSVGSGGFGPIVTSPYIENSTGTFYYRPHYDATVSGCNLTDGAETTVTVVNDPSWQAINIPVINICEGGEITFNTNFTGGVGGSFNWLRATSPGGAGSTISSPNTENNDGTYYYRPQYISTVSGCNLTDGLETIITVVDDPIWDVISVPVSAICEGGELSFSTATIGGIGGYFEWIRSTTSGGIGSVVISPIEEDLSGTYFYRPKYSSTVSGCNLVDGTETMITVVDDPIWSNINLNPQTLCTGEELSFSAEFSGGFNGDIEWIRSTTTLGAGSIVASPLVEPEHGDYYFRPHYISQTSGCNLDDGTEIEVSVKPRPEIINAEMIQSICSGSNSNIVILETDLANSNINWIITNVSQGVSGFTNNMTTNNHIIPIQTLYNSTNSPGVIEYSIYIEKDGCSGELTNYVITVNPTPTIETEISETICYGDSIQLNVSGGINYSWSPNETLNNITISNPIATPVESTQYHVTVTDSNNCENSASINIIVNPTPDLNIDASETEICYGQSTNLFASGIGSFIWSNSESLNNPFSAFPIASPEENTIYTVILTNQFNCSVTDSIEIIVNPVPEFNLGDDIEICNYDTANIIYNGDGTLNWNTGETTPQISVTPQSNNYYTLTVTNSFGCDFSDSLLVIVHQLPIADAGQDIDICLGSSAQLNASGGVNYNWAPDEYLDFSDIYNPQANPNVSTTYYVNVIDENECAATDSVKVNVFDNPNPTITGELEVCKNEQWVEYSTEESTNGLTWEVENGQIMSGQYTNKIFVHWSKTAEDGNVVLREFLWDSPNCSTTEEFFVQMSATTSPDNVEITVKSNNLSTGILVLSNQEYSNIQWGYEKKSDRIEVNTCSNIDWCNFTSIDTAINYYWVKVWDNIECPTKTYFNRPETIIYAPLFNLEDEICLYPNPSNGQFTMMLNNDYYGVLNIVIFDITGREIYSDISQKSQQEWLVEYSLNDFHDGIYFMRVELGASVRILKLVIE